MSAMRVLTPNSPAIPSRPVRRSVRQATVTHLVRPISGAIPISIPQGRATNRRFAVIVLVAALIALFAQLQVNNLATAAAHKNATLASELADVNAQLQTLETQVATLEAPDLLMTKARKMGMVPVETPVFVRLSDHKILGKPVPAVARNY